MRSLQFFKYTASSWVSRQSIAGINAGMDVAFRGKLRFSRGAQLYRLFLQPRDSPCMMLCDVVQLQGWTAGSAGKWTLDGNSSELWPAPADVDAWRSDGDVAPVYPASKPMSAPDMRDAVDAALRVLARDAAAWQDPLPADMVAEHELMDWAQARHASILRLPADECALLWHINCCYLCILSRAATLDAAITNACG